MGGLTTRGEKGEHVANEPDMVPIRREKHERTLEPVSAGLTRRAPGHPRADSASATSVAPFLRHTDSTERVLEAPIPLPDV